VAALAAPVLDRVAPAEPETPAAAGTAPLAWSFGRAIVAPIAELHGRFGLRLWAIMAMVALYRMPDFVSGVMANPLYRQLGYTLPQIAGVTKLYGIWIGLCGSFVAGWAIARFGLYATFVVGAAAGAASHLSLSWLALSGPDLWTFGSGEGGWTITIPWRLAVAISIDNFGGSFAGTALIAYMSGLTAAGFAATQYALFSSLYALPGKLVAGSAGFFVVAYGFPTFFALTAAIGIPVVILCLIVGRTREVGRDAPKLDTADGLVPAQSTG
jgi:PAT family beta-lactamase induction signal transducer AmpG